MVEASASLSSSIPTNRPVPFSVRCRSCSLLLLGSAGRARRAAYPSSCVADGAPSLGAFRGTNRPAAGADRRERLRRQRRRRWRRTMRPPSSRPSQLLDESGRMGRRWVIDVRVCPRTLGGKRASGILPQGVSAQGWACAGVGQKRRGGRDRLRRVDTSGEASSRCGRLLRRNRACAGGRLEKDGLHARREALQ